MILSIRSQRRLYTALAFGLSIGVLGLWGSAWSSWHQPDRNLGLIDLSHNDDVEPQTIKSAASIQANGATPLTLDAFRDPAVAWARPLRGPLYDPPPPPPPVATPPPPLQLKLLGTIIEPAPGSDQINKAAASQAILLTATGQVEMHRIGSMIDEARLIAIEADTIKVEYHGETRTLNATPQ
ncbi:MAG: hypothetical protein AAF911_15270 [Planctomycetota bacterium]